MTKIFLDKADTHFQNLRKYEELVCIIKIYKGKAYSYHKYQDKNFRGLGFQVWKGFLAVLAMISVIGILFFRKQVLALWNEARIGKQVYSVYQTRHDKDPQVMDFVKVSVPKASEKKPEKAENFITDEELRIISRGLLSKPTLTPKTIEDIKKTLEDQSVQRSRFNGKEHPGLSVVDVNDISKKTGNHISIFSLEAVLRLLVIRGEAAFCARGSGSFGYLLSTVPYKDLEIKYGMTKIYTKEDLIHIDQYLTKHFVDIAKLKIKTEYQDILKNIVDKINEQHFDRAQGTPNLVELQTNTYQTRPILDQLVLKGLIESYNITSNHAIFQLKLSKDDIPNPKYQYQYQYKVWRDKSVIQSEEKFQQENKIQLSPTLLNEFKGKREALIEMINELNQRKKPGLYESYSSQWSHYHQEAAKFLKEKGLIFNFSKTPVTFIIWVKPEDQF